jgi:hypothetical protein
MLLLACIACGRLNGDPQPADAKRTLQDGSGPGSDAGITMDSGMPVPDSIMAQPE